MNTGYNKSPSININDIESRIIILKRRAAEANFLREERDMLLNRLKLYSNDYAWAERSENLNAGEQTDNENFQMLKQENENLLKENQLLNEHVHALSSEITNLESITKDFELIKEENTYVKDELMKMTSLEENVHILLKEKDELNNELESVLEVLNSDDPNDKCKCQMKRLLNRANELKKEKDSLRDQLIEKNLKIDILLGKISHLEARLNEKYIFAKLKISLEEQLEADEALLWTVQKIENANKIMGNDLAELTDKFDNMNSKYQELLRQTKKPDLFRGLSSTQHPMDENPALYQELGLYRNLSNLSFRDLERKVDFWPSRLDMEGRSTGPSSRQSSVESLDIEGQNVGSESLLAALSSATKAISKRHSLLIDIKKQLKKAETLNYSQQRYFYSDAHAEYMRQSFKNVRSNVL